MSGWLNTGEPTPTNVPEVIWWLCIDDEDLNVTYMSLGELLKDIHNNVLFNFFPKEQKTKYEKGKKWEIKAMLKYEWAPEVS